MGIHVPCTFASFPTLYQATWSRFSKWLDSSLSAENMSHSSPPHPTLPCSKKSSDKDVAASLHVALHIIPFPSKEVGLPEGIENLVAAKDRVTASKIHMGMCLLQQQIEQFLDECPPDCIVSDICLQEAIRRPDSPHLMAKSDYEPFVIPGLPDPITMMRSQLRASFSNQTDHTPKAIITPVRVILTLSSNRFTKFTELWRDAELRSYGVVLNNFYELDPVYTDLYKKLRGHKVFNIGPVRLIHRNSGEKAEKAHKAVIEEEECLAFLNSKTPSSVLYICFGSACIFPNNQLMEIACGLEASGHNFMWVVFGKDDEKDEERDKWLPKGFEERTKWRGMIIKGWALQLLILDHPSVLGIGVEVGKKHWSLWVWDDLEKEVVGRLNIEDTVRRVMDAGDPVGKMRREKARAWGKKAHEALEEGGFSHQNLTVLIQELKELREMRG
ncbi:unnamed protein product [Thlaspi arvense]|uniref:Uncharacterized protein n=1 Tax=Thlaspi arvense TaxID=13288 RepID=A0AAU9T0T5_THLAR|nr:unnamed protein product [Thlaspi arvense]